MELWDLLDEYGNKTGKTINRGVELKENQYHLEVHLWVINSLDQILIQKRNRNLKNVPGIWATTAGCVTHGEESLNGLLREAKEELGLDINISKLSEPIRYKRKNAFVDIWILKDDISVGDLVLQEEEVEAVKLVSFDELQNMLKEGTFFEYNGEYLNIVFKALGVC